VNAGLVTALERSGLGLVSSTRLDGRYVIRLCILAPATTADDVEAVLAFLETAEPAVADEALERYERHPHLSTNRSAVAEVLGGGSDERVVAAGETIVAQGDSSSRDFYVVVEGRLDVIVDGERVRTLGPGDFFGELALLTEGGTRTARCRAKTDVRCIAFDRVGFENLVREHPDIAATLLETALTRLD
jgi:CRP-like cAMP-binding protein